MSKSYVGAAAKILHRIDCGWESLQFLSRTDGAYGLRTVEYSVKLVSTEARHWF